MAEAFDPKAFLNDAAPSVPISSSNFDPKAFLSDAPPSVPISGVQPVLPPEDTRSETEKRLTADSLRALLEARNKGGGGSMTERATDWVVPGIKNVLGGLSGLNKGLFAKEGTLGEHWSAGVNAEKQFREQNREKTAGPLGYAADVGGAVVGAGRPGGPFTPPKTGPITSTAPIHLNAVSEGAPVVQATSQAARTLPGAIRSGATQGAISGAAENSQDLSSAIQGGLKGGITGGVVGGGTHAVTGAVAKALQDRLARGAAAERAGQRGPTSAEYYKQAGDKFKELDNAGIQFDRSQAMRLAGLLPKTLKDAKYTASAAPELTDALTSIGNIGKKGAPPLTFTELQALRGNLSKAAEANPQNANLRRISGHVTTMLDDFVNSNQPAINKTGADLAKLYPEARQLWRTGILGDTVTDIEKIAANNAAVRSTGADDLARRGLVQQANKDIRSGLPTLPPAAEAARQAAIDGTWKQRAADAVAEGSKNWQVNAATGAGLGSALGTMTGMPIGITGPVAGLLGAGAGKGVNAAAKGVANSEAQNNMDTLVRTIMTGSADRPQVWDMPRDLLASLLARRGVQRGAVNAALPGGEYVIDELTKNR
jgi:hypothetical protein